MIALRDLLQEISRREEVQSDKEYKILGVKWYAKGLFVKDIKKGSEIQAKYVYRVNKGDFIYSRLFAWKGSFGIVTEEFDGCYVSNEFPCFSLKKERLNIEYLMWFFNQPHVWDNCLEKSEGSTAISRNRLKLEKFLDIMISLPSIEIQEKEVSKLNFVYKKGTELLDLKHDSEAKISKLRNAIILEAIQGKLVNQDSDDEPASKLLEKIKNEKDNLIKNRKVKIKNVEEREDIRDLCFQIPETWEFYRFSEVVFFQEGPGIRNWQFTNQGVKLLNVSNIVESGLVLTNSDKYISIEEFESKYTHFLIEEGDLLFASSGGSWGKTAWFQDPGYKVILNTSTIRLRFYSKMFDDKYLEYFLKSSFFRNQMELQLVGMQPNFGSTHLSRCYIPIPPINEQKKIVDRLNQIMALCDDLENKIYQTKKECEKLMQAVLQEAFGSSEDAVGKLVKADLV